MKFCCPICRSPLSLSEKSYYCENKHSYDVAKEGYVNLLPVQKKNSKKPGDNKEMINARRAFLSQGYYNPLISKLTPIFDESSRHTLLDSGCGEGFYSAQISQEVSDLEVIGFDISKEAIKKAAKKYKGHSYLVSSVQDIPIIDNSIDYILTIFAPINENEFDRILTSNGKIIIISAGPQHMKEVAEIIYDEFKPHVYNPEKKLSTHFKLERSSFESFTITVQSKEDRLNFLKMTPYYWSAKEKSITHILELESFDITCDFLIQIYSKVN